MKESTEHVKPAQINWGLIGCLIIALGGILRECISFMSAFVFLASVTNHSLQLPLNTVFKSHPNQRAETHEQFYVRPHEI